MSDELVKTAVEFIAKELAKEGAKRGPDIYTKSDENLSEAQKHCKVCGKRISKDAQYVFGERFVCKMCGHRTHVHCGDTSKHICHKCQGR